MSTVTPGAPTASGQEAAGWTAYLAGVPLGLELPEDRPHATERTYHEGRCPLAPSPSLLGGIAALAHKERTAPAMVWLAALQALLHRYTSETDVLVGSPAAGAEPAETAAPAVVAWRTRLDGDLSFRMLLGRVEAVRRTLEQLGPLSVEACGELLHGEAVPTDLPLFQVGFVPAEVAGPAVLTGWVARTDLTLLLAGEDRPAAVELAFNRDRFEPATVERLARHLRTLMGSAVADPDRRLSELPLLSEAERHQILVEWNATSAEFPRDRLFHQIVEEQAARTPEATAVVDQGERLTYQQLNARTNQLAHHLRALGAGEGTRVVVGLERSAANIVAVLAILKAGAGAVLLDPVNPPRRLGFMLRDAEPVALVTREGLLERFPGSDRLPVVCVDRDQDLLTAQPAGNPPPAAVTQDSVSHVIYTSGSTGEPKGVMMRHRAMTDLASWAPRAFGLSPEDRAAWVSSPGFGVSLIEWPPFLAVGATVYVASRDVSASPERMRDWLAANSVTFAALVGSLAVRVWALAWPATTALRFMLTAGELVREWPPHDLPFEVVIAYGSTEGGGTITYDEGSGIYATSRAFTAEERARLTPPPVGRPMANSRVYVLDPYGQPVPPGVPGELYAAGDSLSVGYLNRPELMAEKFVANWLPEELSATLCRTGDLAKYSPDGLVQILGRIDSQVKIRGFRIELGEIETVLAEQPAVDQVAVVAREDVPGDRKLVAYVVPGREPSLSLRQLRQALHARLPYYMVPAAFVVLEELPRLPNGKLDRRGLPAPVLTREALETEFVAPRDDTEERLADIWSELLRIEEIGVDDSFFELGGHSLLAAELTSVLKDEFKVEIDLTEFAEGPTIAELARTVQRARP